MPLHLSLPQTSPHDGDPYTRTPEEIAAWLPTLPRDQPADAARAIVDALAALNRTRVRITLRQEITELLRAAADDLIPHLRDALAAATVPLSTNSRSAASLAEELLTELAYSYKLLLVEQSRRLFGFASSGRALLPVLRAMEVLARRLEVGYRTYAHQPQGRVERTPRALPVRPAPRPRSALARRRYRHAALRVSQRAAARLCRAAEAHAG